MITHASEPLPKIEILGLNLRIHLDELLIENVGRKDYRYNTVSLQTSASRVDIIEAIISSKYSLAGEIALSNNRDLKPLDFKAYQDFRVFAKALADEVLSKLISV